MNQYEPSRVLQIKSTRANPLIGFMIIFTSPVAAYMLAWLINTHYRWYYELPFQWWIQ